jgi:hypothetical protein
MSKISKLFTAFNDVKFDDIPHKYYHNGIELTSVTTLIGRYCEEFDEEYWSAYKSKEFGVEQWKIKDAWDFINKRATTKGSIIHNYAENLFNNKILHYPKDQIIQNFGYDPIYDDYLKQKKLVDKFYYDSIKTIIPIKTELVVYDKEYLLGGMVDLLVYNKKDKEYQIWDYKTNKEFKYESERYLNGKLGMLEDSDLIKYSLQLGLYKYIIEKNTNIKLGRSFLVWLPVDDDNYQTIECEEMFFYINSILNDRKYELENAS